MEETMKCVQNVVTLAVKRLSDKEASMLVETEEWKYIPKNVWKATLQIPKHKRRKEHGNA
jgi:hypothetical protein